MIGNLNEIVIMLGTPPALFLVVKGTVVVALGLIGARLARNSRAAVRHALLASTFGVLLALPVVSIVARPVPIAVPITTDPSIASPPFDDIAAPVLGVLTVTPHSDEHSSEGLQEIRLSTVLLYVWFIGGALFAILTIRGMLQVRFLRRFALPWRQGQAVAEELAPGIRRQVEVLLHETLTGPLTCGVLRPAIILPADAEGWKIQDLERALIHELEHVRRHDWTFHCLARIACAAYWFHPLVWAAWRQFALEAERACDDAVLRRSEPIAYADQLLGLARRLPGAGKSPALAMASRSDLSARVGALLDGRQRRGPVGTVLVAACIAAAAIVLTMSPLRMVAAPQSPQNGVQGAAPPAPMQAVSADLAKGRSAAIHAQSPALRANSASNAVRAATPVQIAQVQPVPAKAKPGQTVSARSPDPPLAFDVASVKATDPRLNSRGFGYFTKYSPDTLTIRDISMWMCVRLAYGVENFRIAGPDSMQKPPFYDIVAKAASPVPESQLRLMLRKLLADRFHLTLHWEKQEMSVTALLVAKGGSKIHPTTGAFDPEHGDDAHMQNLGYDNNVHIQRSAGTNGNVRFTFTNASMALFATWLESSSSVYIYDKAPVVDLTGMPGRFDWVVDSPLVQPPSGGDGAGTPIVADGSTGGVLLDHYKPILERELGLTLGRRKAMVDIMVIDHVDKEPTPN